MELLPKGSQPISEIAPLLPGDTATVQAVFDGLSAEQRFHRFHVPMPRLPRYMLRLLADVDGVRHAALVLRVGGRPVGIARYVVTALGRAEFAIVVGSAHVRRGYGTDLLEALLGHARANGVSELDFVFLPDNLPVRRLLDRRDTTVRLSDGRLHGSVRTAPAVGRHRAHAVLPAGA